MHYLNKYKLAKELSEYYVWQNKKEKTDTWTHRDERKFQKSSANLMESINLMVEGSLHRPEFYRFINLHNDMRGQTFLYIMINLQKKNIKVKRLKVGESAFIKTKSDIKNSKVKENFPYDLLGKEVIITKKISNSVVEVKDIETEKLYEVDLSSFGYANAFSYITSIIDSNFRKVRNAAHLKNNKMKFFSCFEKPNIEEWNSLTEKEKFKVIELHEEYIHNRNKQLSKNPIEAPKKNNLFTLKL